MPADIVKSFAEKTGKSIEEVEKLWMEAKAEAQKSYEENDDAFYPTVVTILKNKLGIKESKVVELLGLVEAKQYELEVTVSIARKVADYIEDLGYDVEQVSTNVWVFKDKDEHKMAVEFVKDKFGDDEVLSEGIYKSSNFSSLRGDVEHGAVVVMPDKKQVMVLSSIKGWVIVDANNAKKVLAGPFSSAAEVEKWIADY